MRPIELLTSIERLAAAEDVQLQRALDPYQPGGQLATKSMHEENLLEHTTVREALEKDGINPDGKGEPHNRTIIRKKATPKKDDDSTEPGPSGHHLDILA